MAPLHRAISFEKIRPVNKHMLYAIGFCIAPQAYTSSAQPALHVYRIKRLNFNECKKSSKKVFIFKKPFIAHYAR